jgi:hypothetical protein
MGIANETLIPVNGDHRSMCRISKEDDDDVFGIIYPVLQRVVTEALLNREAQYSLQSESVRSRSRLDKVKLCPCLLIYMLLSLPTALSKEPCVS